MDQPGKVANPARGQLNRENNIPLSPCMPENLAVNAIGTHLRDPINSGLTRWCMMLDAAPELRRNPVSKDQIA